MYGCLYVKSILKLEVLGLKTDLELSWAKGQIGAMPIFKSKQDALDYADGDEDKVFEVVEHKGISDEL